MVAERGEATLCVVCDGSGAGTSGWPAAALAISVLGAAFDSGAPPALVLASVLDAHRAILSRSEAAQRGEPGADVRWHGMGTTAEVALFVERRAHLAHVGDGGIYRLRQGRLDRLTSPHTLVNELRRTRPELGEEELAELPKNVLVRALGLAANVEIDRHDVDTLPGDVWLLCSDGLTKLVPEDEIAGILRRGGAADVVSAALLSAALGAPSPPGEHKDNVTVVVHVVAGWQGGEKAARSG